MECKSNIVSESPRNYVINPISYDVSMISMLNSLGVEKYINIFRDHNIGKSTLTELTDEDLTKMGIDDPQIRLKFLEEVKNLTIYAETDYKIVSPNLNLLDIIDVMEDSTQHIHRIYLSMMTNLLVLKKKKYTDCLIYKDKYTSHIALTTLSHMTNVLNSMEIALHTQMKTLSKNSRINNSKKLVVGTVGSAVIAVLAIFFVRSLKQLH